jgi:hypothetical protein
LCRTSLAAGSRGKSRCDDVFRALAESERREIAPISLSAELSACHPRRQIWAGSRLLDGCVAVPKKRNNWGTNKFPSLSFHYFRFPPIPCNSLKLRF